jgi:hypothetical protein
VENIAPARAARKPIQAFESRGLKFRNLKFKVLKWVGRTIQRGDKKVRVPYSRIVTYDAKYESAYSNHHRQSGRFV